MATGAELVARGLAAAGVEHAFAIVSIHNMPILDAINQLGATKLIDVRHEQSGMHAADGYARATGKMGVMIASTGPGTSNCMTGLLEAAAGSSRVLLITGQAATDFYGRGLGYVHENDRQLDMLASVCRRVASPRESSAVAPELAAVIRDIHTARAQPGAIEVPIDLQYEEADDFEFDGLFPQPKSAKAESVQRAADALAGSNRRVIVVGGGVIAAGAGEQLVRLAERLEAPVLTNLEGRGVIADDHPLCLGNFFEARSIHKAMRDADVTLAIGTSFAAGVGGAAAALTPPGKLIQIDVDPSVVGRMHRAEIPVIGDAALTLEALLSALTEVAPNDSQFNDGLLQAAQGLKAGIRPRLGKEVPVLLDAIRAALPRDGLWLRDTTLPATFFGNQLFPVFEPRTSIAPSSSAIGPGLPMAIGAVLGAGRRGVVIHGDGGLLFHATELATAAQYHLPLIICVFNDSGYGVLRWLQEGRFGRVNETDLGPVDFAKLASSLNVAGERVTSVSDFETALDRGMSVDGPYVIDIQLEHFAPYELGGVPPAEARRG
ncbi:MAG: thiamine pyrophosphate-binding protein [Pseudomonadaceae bacterium]|nr:thiamine pyrophosphate-binding protein [Pseudomonadaceae bacterium]